MTWGVLSFFLEEGGGGRVRISTPEHAMDFGFYLYSGTSLKWTPL